MENKRPIDALRSGGRRNGRENKQSESGGCAKMTTDTDRNFMMTMELRVVSEAIRVSAPQTQSVTPATHDLIEIGRG